MWFGDLVNWANQNQGFTSLVFAVIGSLLVATTVVLSYLVTRATQAAARAAEATAQLTSRLVDETVQLRRVETDPDIAIYIEMQRFSSVSIDMVIRNVGRGSAHNLRLVLDPPEGVTWTDATGQAHSLLDLALITGGLEYMAPGQEKRFLYGGINTLSERPIMITAIYEGKNHPPGAPQFRDTFAIDLGVFGGVYVPTGVPEVSIPRSLKEIARSMNRLTRLAQSHQVAARGVGPTSWPTHGQELAGSPDMQETVRKLLTGEMTVDDIVEQPKHDHRLSRLKMLMTHAGFTRLAISGLRRLGERRSTR